MKHQVVLTNSYEHIIAVWDEWAKLTGRHYQPVERYRTEDAKILLLTMGCLSEVARIAVDEMRDEGLPVGLLRLRMWRPFPFQDLRAGGGRRRAARGLRPGPVPGRPRRAGDERSQERPV